MSILTADMRRVLDEQQLGFIATVAPDGTPNLSPKGTTAAFDDDHLVFADICSPGTIVNLRANPALEVNVVDVFVRKGYRFKGTAEIFAEGARFDELLAFARKRGSKSPIRHMVLMKVTFAAPLVSPSYDQGLSEAEVTARWMRHWSALHTGRE